MMRILIAEYEFTSRNILLEMLRPYGKCDIAVNGNEALDAFKLAHEEAEPYKMICLGITLPEYDGLYALSNIRRLEEEKKVPRKLVVKIIMTAASADYSTVLKAFNEQSDAFLIKPVKEKKLQATLKNLNLI